MTQKFEKLSPARLSVPLLEGLELVNRGKVRDTYRLGNGKLLVVVTDGISIFDFVLNVLIPQKGYVLAAMAHFFLLFLESKGIKTHFIAAGVGIDEHIPEHHRNNPDLQRRSMVVHELDMVLVEFIIRFCLAGSAWKEYREHGTINGKPMPAGMREGDELLEPLFTPTTKAQDGGHDMPLNEKEVREQYPEEVALFMRSCELTFPEARSRSIIAPDTKKEVGRDRHGVLRIGDEVFTADSSRFWDMLVWQKSRNDPNRKAPPPLDKQFVRTIGIEHGVDKLDPKNPEHVARVHAIVIPDDVVAETTKIYRYACDRLLGMNIEEYGRQSLGVDIPYVKKKIAFVFGSRSDIPQMAHLLKSILVTNLSLHLERPDVHVLSCHRHDAELRAFVNGGCGGADVIIATAGMAAALPGMMATYIKKRGIKIPVIGVGVDGPTPEDLDAARLSIKRLPNDPVVTDEVRGEPYMGPDGFHAAIVRVAYGELPPQKKTTPRPAEMYIDIDSL